jgi:hypothetical protein
MLDPSDDPADPRYADPSLPRFTVPSPMLVDPPEGSCPYCETVLLAACRKQNEGDAAICIHCLGLAIATPTGTWRHSTFDEAAAWDQDPRVRTMRTVWNRRDPES